MAEFNQMFKHLEEFQFNHSIIVTVELKGRFRDRYCLFCAKSGCCKLRCYKRGDIVPRYVKRTIRYKDRFISDVMYLIKKNMIESTKFGITNMKMRNEVYIYSRDIRCPRHNGYV